MALGPRTYAPSSPTGWGHPKNLAYPAMPRTENQMTINCEWESLGKNHAKTYKLKCQSPLSISNSLTATICHFIFNHSWFILSAIICKKWGGNAHFFHIVFYYGQTWWKTLSMWLIGFGIDFGGCKVFIAESMAKVMKHWQTTSLRKAILFLLLLTMN